MAPPDTFDVATGTLAVRVQPRRTPLLGLVAANGVSLVGSALTAVALPWFVLRTTGSAAQTGLVAAFAVLPAFAAGILGGALVDRVGYKRFSVVADLVSGAAIALIPLLYHTTGLAFWQLLLLVFAGALLEIPGLTSRRSLLPELAASARWPLERANAAFESSQHLSLLLGPPLAGILIAWLDASSVLWIDAASFALSALLVVSCVTRGTTLGRRASDGRYLDSLAEGFRFIRRDHLLLVLALTLAASNALTGPLFALLLPVYAATTFGDAAPLGLALGAEGAGALIGALAFGAVGHRFPRRATWLAAFLVGPSSLWVLALSPPLPVLLVALAAIALVGGPLNPLLVTIRHERIPPELRGRVFATFSAIAMGAQPLGLLVAGLLVQGLGFRPAVVLLAAAAQAIGVALLFVPILRQMDAPNAMPNT